MSWNESTPVPDRIFSCLAYLLPLADGIVFGIPLFKQFPILANLLLPISPVLVLYNTIPFAGLAIFFALFLLVVRNDSVSHFIRFNVLQAILLDIILIVCRLILGILVPAIGQGLLMETLFNTVFLGLTACIIASVVQAIRGQYADIPAISDAVNAQLPR